MQPKQYIVFKWCVYGTATLLFCLLQRCILSYIRFNGVTPFLYPLLAAVAAVSESRTGGPFFALGLGTLCDLILRDFPPGFHALVFTLAALGAAMIAEFLLSPGLPCSLAAGALTFALLDLGRLALFFQRGQGSALGALAEVALWEFGLTLPLLPVVERCFRKIHRRMSEDY